MEVGKYIDFHNDNSGKHDFLLDYKLLAIMEIQFICHRIMVH